MKEQIFEIICNHEQLVNLPFLYKEMLAEEIDILTKKHYMKFMEWFMDNKDCNFELGKLHLIEEVYQYWFVNILNK